MNKNTALLIGALRDEVVIIQTFYEGDAFDETPIEVPLQFLDAQLRVKCLQYLHIPITKHLGRITDNERHNLFSVAFGRNITTADQITNFEALAWRRLISRFDVGSFIKRALQEMVNERQAA